MNSGLMPRLTTLLSSTMALSLLGLVSPLAAFTPGKDGDLTVSTANTIVNIYTTVSQNASAGDNRIRQTADSNVLGLTVGDLILIYQATGAAINTTNTFNFGNVNNLNGAGRFEFARVTSVPVFTGAAADRRFIGVQTTCGGLENSYTVSEGSIQIIKVPQYDDLTLTGSGSIVAQAWDGTTGGVVAFTVNGVLSMASGTSVNATQRGFRGGAFESTGAPNGNSDFSTTTADNGARKGEGIAG